MREHTRRRSLASLAVGAVVLSTAGLAGAADAAPATQVIRASDIGTWDGVGVLPDTPWYVNTSQKVGAGADKLVNVPGPAEVGLDGALQLDTTTATDQIGVHTARDLGKALSSLTSIQYTARTLGDTSPAQQPAFQVFLQCATTPDSFVQLNYEPLYNDPALTLTGESWQRFNALGSGARWWASRTINANGTTADPTTDPTTGGIKGGETNRLPFSAFATLCDANNGTVFDYGVNLGPGTAPASVQVDQVEVNGVTTDFAVDTATRISGADRYATGIATSKAGWADKTADYVVLANGSNFPDALAGVPLAAQGGPLLLTPATVLLPTVKAEIARVLKPSDSGVIILGGTGAVSAAIETELKTALGASRVERIGGADRYQTALLVTTALRDILGANFGPVFVADGLNFPDALSAGAAAGSYNGGIVLSAGTALTTPVKNALTSWKGSGTTIYGAGGNGQAAAGALATESFVGTDRYDTSAKIATKFFGPAATPVASDWGLASGLAFPDAMSGGAFMGGIFGPMLLTAPTALPASVEGYLTASHPQLTDGWVFGGTGAVSDPVAASALAAASGSTVPVPAVTVSNTVRSAPAGQPQLSYRAVARAAR